MDKKVTPFNSEAEQYVLGSVFLNPSLIQNMNDTMDPSDFYEERHQAIFLAMKALFQTGMAIDLMTVTDELEKQAKLHLVGGVEYLAAIAQSVPSVANVGAYIQIVKDLSLKRAIINTTRDLLDKGYDPKLSSTDYVDIVEDKIMQVAKKRRTTTFNTISSVASDVVKKTA